MGDTESKQSPGERTIGVKKSSSGRYRGGETNSCQDDSYAGSLQRQRQISDNSTNVRQQRVSNTTNIENVDIQLQNRKLNTSNIENGHQQESCISATDNRTSIDEEHDFILNTNMGTNGGPQQKTMTKTISGTNLDKQQKYTASKTNGTSVDLQNTQDSDSTKTTNVNSKTTSAVQCNYTSSTTIRGEVPIRQLDKETTVDATYHNQRTNTTQDVQDKNQNGSSAGIAHVQTNNNFPYHFQMAQNQLQKVSSDVEEMQQSTRLILKRLNELERNSKTNEENTLRMEEVLKRLKLREEREKEKDEELKMLTQVMYKLSDTVDTLYSSLTQDWSLKVKKHETPRSQFGQSSRTNNEDKSTKETRVNHISKDDKMGGNDLMDGNGKMGVDTTLDKEGMKGGDHMVYGNGMTEVNDKKSGDDIPDRNTPDISVVDSSKNQQQDKSSMVFSTSMSGENNSRTDKPKKEDTTKAKMGSSSPEESLDGGESKDACAPLHQKTNKSNIHRSKVPRDEIGFKRRVTKIEEDNRILCMEQGIQRGSTGSSGTSLDTQQNIMAEEASGGVQLERDGTTEDQDFTEQLLKYAANMNQDVLEQLATMRTQNGNEYRNLVANPKDLAQTQEMIDERSWAQWAQYENDKAKTIKSSRANGPDTVLCFDISASMEGEPFRKMLSIARTFINEIETISQTIGINENIALVTFGHETRVVKHMCNDYRAIKSCLDSLYPDGPTPLGGGLLMALAGALGHGSPTTFIDQTVMSRIILISDGKATLDSIIGGPDVEPDLLGGFQVHLRLRTVATDLKQRGNRVFCIPVGQANQSNLELVSSTTGGKVVPSEGVPYLVWMYRNFALAMKLRQDAGGSDLDETIIRDGIRIGLFPGVTENHCETIIEFAKNPKLLAHDLTGALENLMSKKMKENMEIPESTMPPIGTRVQRGKDWQWNDQDSGGLGTIVGHQMEGWVYVMWDKTDNRNTYRFGHDGLYDLEICTEPRILKSDEMIAVGCAVKRGPDWKWNNQDGGDGNIGYVFRVHENGQVKVRWPNGYKDTYRYGADGSFDLIICAENDVKEYLSKPPSTDSSSSQQDLIPKEHKAPVKKGQDKGQIRQRTSPSRFNERDMLKDEKSPRTSNTMIKNKIELQHVDSKEENEPKTQKMSSNSVDEMNTRNIMPQSIKDGGVSRKRETSTDSVEKLNQRNALQIVNNKQENVPQKQEVLSKSLGKSTKENIQEKRKLRKDQMFLSDSHNSTSTVKTNSFVNQETTQKVETLQSPVQRCTQNKREQEIIKDSGMVDIYQTDSAANVVEPTQKNENSPPPLRYLWSYRDENCQWVQYPTDVCYKIEVAYKKKPTGTFVIQLNQQNFRIHFPKMIQVNTITKDITDIRRTRS